MFHHSCLQRKIVTLKHYPVGNVLIVMNEFLDPKHIYIGTNIAMLADLLAEMCLAVAIMDDL